MITAHLFMNTTPGTSNRQPATSNLRRRLLSGLVIPACPLALTAARRLDDRRQRALFRYYLASGAGGLAVGVHTTQFAIRNPEVALLKPVLELGASVARQQTDAGGGTGSRPVLIAGVCGRTPQALTEAALARELGYDAGLVSLGAWANADEEALVAHCQAVAEVIPIVGFYLQPAAGGRVLAASFWRRLATLENVVAIKIAPFNRYQTLDVIRAVTEAGRDDIALYTGNDDNIVFDLLTPFRFEGGDGRKAERRIVGGLLGHWAVWTQRAVEIQAECRRLALAGGPVPVDMLRLANEVTDANAAFFDAANGYAGCIAGLHEILRRQGLLEGNWCLDLKETFGPGQLQEIDRVCRAYPHLADDKFVAAHRDEWLRG